MSLFGKKGKVVLTSEEQRDAFIEKLQNAHVDYRVFEIEDSAYSRKKVSALYIHGYTMEA